MKALLLLFPFLFVSSLKGQTIKLEEIWVKCYPIEQGDSIIHKPEEIAITISVVNDSPRSVLIGTNSIYSKKKPKLGYFEIKSKNKQLLRLNANYLVCIPSNYKFPIYSNSFFADEYIQNYDYGNDSILEDDSIYSSNSNVSCFEKYSIKQFETFSEILKSIISNITIHYHCIKADYDLKIDCDSILCDQEVIMDDYILVLANGDIALRWYHITKGKVQLLDKE